MSSFSLLRPEEVPNEFICAICFCVPLEPKLLPCEHVFCVDCIQRLFETQKACPTCRISCAQNQTKDLKRNSLASRIWSSIQVKCDHSEEGCAWTGSISDLKSHRRKCCSVITKYENQDESSKLKEENEKLKTKYKKLKEKLEKKQDIIDALKSYRKLMAELKEKQDVIDALKTKFKSHSLVQKTSASKYEFSRSNVVELAQLISRYLENKPRQIDSNRIYQCVRKCYRDLEADYSDNPEYYYMDMHMLLTTCVASTWFTDKQRGNIQDWLDSYYHN